MIRKAGINDLELLIKLRFDFLHSLNEFVNAEEHRSLTTELTDYFRSYLNSADLVALLFELEKNVAGTAFLIISHKPAHPLFANGKTGTILNVLVYPPFRRQGIATQLIQRLLKEAKAKNVSLVDLHATPEGSTLYRKLGFNVPLYENLRIMI
ncbi:MAG: GNAT family N-acetyltransferase [Syntrophomonadaceae bacterium]|nr:GNAT family N-acetyltransferase [Syntrophomonadaceae bacterium]